MESTITSELRVSADDSVAFARLSGDFNPLHLDPVVARRTPFGGTVVHGIHLFLGALESLALRGLLGTTREPVGLSASFHTPVMTGARVEIRTTVEGNRLQVSAAVAGRPAFAGSIELGETAGDNAALEDAEFVPAAPRETSFPPAIELEAVPLRLGRVTLAALFPALARSRQNAWIADLLATTQIVGMRCPGMDSVYSGFKLRRTETSGESSMQYRVERSDARFRLVRLQVTGARLAGTVDTFFRPRPVAQRSMADVGLAVTPGEFAGQRALVVGGSRGLGEVTAKILAAGGADVAITYVRGRDDAVRVCAEVQAVGGKCSAHHLNVMQRGGDDAGDWLGASRRSHVYFFASPPITKNSGEWSEELFQQFKNVYVDAFGALVERVLATRSAAEPPTRFLYPSTIFATDAEPGFAEYAAAKAQGEELCERLQARYGARFEKPRLPRMRTDQTNAIVDVGAADAFPVMIQVVRDFHA